MNLRSIARVNAGYPFRGKIREVLGSSVVVVQMKNVSLSEGVRWSECLETELLGKRAPDYLTVGDILVAARGSHYYAIPVEQELAVTDKQAVAAPHFFVVQLRRNDILPEFLVWWLNQSPTQRYLAQNSEGTLTKSIRRTVLEHAPVVIPSLAKQHSIVGLAKALHEEQKLIQRLINNGERMMEAIAKDLFENKEVRQ